MEGRLKWKREKRGRVIRTLFKIDDDGHISTMSLVAAIKRRGHNRYTVMIYERNNSPRYWRTDTPKEKFDTEDIPLAAVKTIALLMARNQS
jgi:hypothetical protein